MNIITLFIIVPGVILKKFIRLKISIFSILKQRLRTNKFKELIAVITTNNGNFHTSPSDLFFFAFMITFTQKL